MCPSIQNIISLPCRKGTKQKITKVKRNMYIKNTPESLFMWTLVRNYGVKDFLVEGWWNLASIKYNPMTLYFPIKNPL